jgi:hypothetical protein
MLQQDEEGVHPDKQKLLRDEPKAVLLERNGG